MRVSRSTGYALLAVGYIANHKEKNITLSQDIAREYNIPLEYLLKIMQQLVRGNVLRSKRGPRGGFSLAENPKKITMLQIIESVEGPISDRLGIAQQAPGADFVPKIERAYEKAIAQSKVAFDKIKLSDFAK